MAQKRKQMLMTSLIMLIVACIALTSTTFAWFSASETGIVDDFEFTVEDASGIQLSVDAVTWKSTILSSDIKAQVDAQTATPATAQTGSLFVTQVDKFKPVSTHPETATLANDTAKGRLTMFSTTAAVSSSGAEQLVATSETTGYYVFNIYVNNESELLKALKVSDFEVFGVTGSDKNAQLASRVAFIDEGSISKASGTANEVKAAVLATNEAVSVNVLEPNETTHTGFASTYYGVSGSQTTNGVAKSGTYTITNGFIPATGTAVQSVTTFSNTTTTVAVLDPNSITKITVYVWIEGQDIDCNNDIASSSVCVNFKFTAYETNAQYHVTYSKNTTEAVANIPTDGTDYAAKDDVTVKFTGSSGAINRTNYTFLGWASNSSAADPEFTVGGKTGFKIVKDTILYAVWRGSPTLKYNLNGGTASDGWATPSDATVDYAQAVAVNFPTATQLIKSGKIFKGWSTSSSGVAEYTVGGTTNITVKEDTTLYAVWADAVTVTFDKNTTSDGVANMPEAVVVEKNSTYTLPTLSPVPTYTGYTFKGWTTVSGGTTVQYLANGVAAFTVDKNITLYAVWEAN